MKTPIQNKLHKILFGILIAAAGSTPVASAAGFGLFNHSACDSNSCDQACCGETECDGLACDGCSSCSLTSCGAGFMKGLIKPSDRCFDDFISPMINFVHFEDPRNLTEIRPIFVNHWVPSTVGNGVPAGGTIQLLAFQFRVALTERLSLIGVKSGYIWDNTDGAVDTLLDSGWASLTAGLKYNFYRDTERGTLASAGATYEIPIGSSKALQTVGDGEFHMFVTAGQRLLDGNAHIMSAFGWRVPSDGYLQTESLHWSNHFDVKLTEKVYLLSEIAWWHWVDSADGGIALGAAGQDLFNLSANDVTGNNLVTQNIGMKYKPSRNREYGIAYEFPLTSFKDFQASRLQLDMIFRY